MGSFIGHVVPGTMFLLLSIWWFIGALFQNVLDNGTRRKLLRANGATKERLKSNLLVWYPCCGRTLSKIPLEAIVKVIFAVLGIIGELLLSESWTLIDKNGKFVADHLNNHGHTAMYSFFGLAGVIDLVKYYRLLPFPLKFDYLVMSAAFWVEGFLFFYHLHGRPAIDVRLHTILYLIIFITATMFLVDIFLGRKQLILFGLMRAFLVGVQGTWFLQIAFVLHGPNPWKNTPDNVAFLAVVFVWHLFLFFAVTLLLFAAVYCLCMKKYTRCNDQMEDISDEEESENIALESF